MQPESLFLEDFGQKVDLTRRIREVLLNYPEGTTVLKELIQNADDAGATVVKLCLDRRNHGTESLISPTLAQWQGPALLAYNDAVFTEEDFVSISRIGGSSKHAQNWKTGRFGVGFNSVYHITDVPSFVSGKHVVFFDPQGAYLPNVSVANPGKRIEYVSTSAISLYKDQFFPYCGFGCDMESPFPGTLFRFPLRNVDQAARSKLARQAYVEDDISIMFRQLFEEGVFMLLFLKNVISIEMYIWNNRDPEPKKLYACSISSVNEKLIWHRQALLRYSKSSGLTDDQMDGFSLELLSEEFVGTQIQKRKDTFYVMQMMASSSSRISTFAATASKEYDIHLLPWASVAACLSEDISNSDILTVGRAFCFLPLPIKTGLPVQVNGYFEVSSNRRGIWYGGDMDRSGKLRSVWNRLLLEDVVAPTFVQLLLCVQRLLGSTDLYYSLWPAGSFEEPWSILVEHIYRKLADVPVLYTHVDGGKWVTPVEAFIHDFEFTRSNELRDVLLQLGMPVVHVSNQIYDMILKNISNVQLKVVTPDTVRQYLKESKILTDLDKDSKLILLEYCIEDLLDADVGANLHRLPLLPLANGDFAIFSDVSGPTSLFICNDLEYMLLQPVSERVIDRKIPTKIWTRLSSIAKSLNTNVRVFSGHDLSNMFSAFVPAEWKYQSRVFWDPNRGCSHPNSTWFRMFWQYLRSQSVDLSLFADWPILPSTSRHLYRASRRSKLIDGDKLSDKIKDILDNIECKIIDPSYGVDHPDLSHYVSDASGPAVSESISHAVHSNRTNLETSFCGLTTEERDELRNFLLDPIWYVGDDMNESHIRICKELPVYRVYGGGSAENIHFSDLQNQPKYLPPLHVSGHFMDDQFVFCSSTREEEVLMRYFGIKRMGKACFYEYRVLNRLGDLQPEVRDNIMLSILQDLPQLCTENSSFKEILANLDFVPTIGGSLKCPGALYDPRNEELYALLEYSDSFPSNAFGESGILDVLQRLGLRTSVSPEAVIQSARHVEKIMHVNQQEAYLRGKVLLSYLEVNAMKWLPNVINNDHGVVEKMFKRATTAVRARVLKSDVEKFWNELRMISWCPVLVSAPFPTLPWPAASSLVAPPIVVRQEKDLWLVSGSMRILDGECSSTALSNNLGWSTPPGGSVLAAQLLELGKNNEIVHDKALRQELALGMPRIYSILTGLVGTEEMDVVKAVLEGSRWIWVGDGFATSDEVVLDGPLHLAPYIRVIPTDLAVFRDLLTDLGIREFLKPIDYANILCKMAMCKGSSSLDAQEIRAAIYIVQHLAEVQFIEQVNIYLPDVSGRLFPAGDLVYNDAPWLLGSEDKGSFGAASTMALSAESKVQKFVHGNISNEVAEKLGVCSLRRMLLAESADSMNLSLSGAAEAFGQHEALTTRLKHILEMYADGPGILFELVQNAEDAGASEVIFLLDKTQYGTSSVLSPEMADWQGPALYCFNDSVFSAKDLYAISRIGQESKLEKPFAIGRFGLGFNCVYHFTDIPIFVSGENVVMFDPHACNLPGVSPSHPGLRIRFMGRRLLEQFPDQFSPFLHFGCDLQQPFPGTLFRFPLRNANVASRSQIKKEVYAPEDVASLFSSFYKVVSEALLFLNNVKTISIFVKESGHEMQLLHRVRRNSFGEPDMGSNVLDRVFDFRDQNQQSGMGKDQFMKKLTKSVGRELLYKYQKCVITEKSSAGVMSHYWMTAECLGVWHAKNSPSSDNNSYSTIPWACVAAHLRSSNNEEEFADSPSDITSILEVSIDSDKNKADFEGRAFCFLPLPISTGLPAHVNAYFELSSNRRDIWFGNDMAGGGKKRSEWNIFLLEDVAAPAYGRLLEKIAAEVGPCDLYFSLWPTKIGLEPWSSMVRKLYDFVTEFGLRVLYTKARGGQWISTKNAIFPDYSYCKALELVEALSYAGLPLVTASKSLVERFMEVQASLHFLTPPLLRTLLSRRKREFEDRNAMILALDYCLLDLNGTAQSDCLFGLPLIPLADGSFTAFSRKEVGPRVYIACGDGYGLLKDSVPHQLVDSGIPEAIYQKLCDVVRSGGTNISFLSCDLLENLFVKVLPVEWHHAKQVAWSPCEQGQPSLEWMRMLWRYLKSCCTELSLFSSWPILPVGDNFLMQLVKNSSIIPYDGWTEKMSSLLLKVGCQFLRRDFPIEHPQLNSFVQSPTAAGILNAFMQIAGSLESVKGIFHNVPEAEMHELRSFILQSKWFSEMKMEKTHIDIIKHLPMFESFKSRKLMCLCEPTKWLKPNDVRQELLHDDFIRVESETEANILRRYFDIREPSRVEFYKNYAFNCIPELLLQDGAFSALLNDVKLLIEEDKDFKNVLSETPFVLAANGVLQQPSRLYDPRIPELQNLLHKEMFFPSDKYSDPETLEILVSLGLKRTLGYTGLLDSAASISMLHDSGDLEGLSYGRKLLAVLDALAVKLSTEEKCNVELRTEQNEEGIIVMHNNTLDENDVEERNIQWVDSAEIDNNCSKDSMDVDIFFSNLSSDKSEEDFWSEMKSISWCPVCPIPPFEGLPWLKSNNLVASPSIVRPKSQMWLVSSSMHILEGECLSLYLQHKLGWKDSPTIGVLTAQLIELSNCYSNLKLYSVEKPNFVTELGNGVLSIYSKLQEYIGCNEFMQLKSALDGVSWIWIGDEFVPSNALAFDSPVSFSPYLYVVTSELSEFRDLLLKLGVRPSFDIWDYIHVLQRLQNDTNGLPLSIDQLSFVHCVLEAIAECCSDKPLEASSTPILIPDSSGRLMSAGELVYNDAPWMEGNPQITKHFVHPNITNDLADRLGVHSLRSLSLVDERMIKDLPCMNYAKIGELSELYGSNNFVFFDMLELADCCQANKFHLIFDKRDHPRQSLLQHNLAEFQGPALVAIFEGASLNREEISSLQLLPPWRLRGDTLNYGLGLLSCYSICDILSIVSNGYFYVFDPRGSVLGAPSSHLPAAKMFSLIGTNLVDRFHDQFNPMLIGQNMPWCSSNYTAIRMPLSSECLKDGSEVAVNRIRQRIDRLLENGSRLLLSLKSLVQVSLYSWDDKSSEPCLYHSISIDSAFSVMRNPFSEKKWRKFQLSRLFSNSNLANKFNVIDVNVFHEGSIVVDKWLVVLSLGSGQTRNMALDRRYLGYNLTPVAGVAALVSHDGHPVDINPKSCIMSPLPLSGSVSIPVTIFGCFIVRHNRGRYLLKYQDVEFLNDSCSDVGNQLIEAWNKELMSCVRDSYIEMLVECQRLRKKELSSTSVPSAVRAIAISLKAYGDQIYSFWPRSAQTQFSQSLGYSDSALSEVPKADWECLVEKVIRPLYAHLVELPVWQLYSGNLVKAQEGMFLSLPGHAVGNNLLPVTVCSFVKKHYPVFSIPWELVCEIQAVGIAVREIKPKMVRDLLKVSSKHIVLKSVDDYVDVLEYCLSDIQILISCNSSEETAGSSCSSQISFTGAGNGSSSMSISNQQNCNSSLAQNSSSSEDAIEMVTTFGKALFDFGRGVVEEIGRSGGPLIQNNIGGINDSISVNNDSKLKVIIADIRGLPFPTTTNHLVKVGQTELWFGNREQQELMVPLASKFIHPKVFDRSVLSNIFMHDGLNRTLKVQEFSLQLLAKNMGSLFHSNWVDHISSSHMAPWFSWESTSGTGGEGGPSPDWIKLFWRNVGCSSEDLMLFSDWPLIPAFLGRPILCRVRERQLVFIPPIFTGETGQDLTQPANQNLETEVRQSYISAFDLVKNTYPWLFQLLNQCNVPVYDTAFLDCPASCYCLPASNQSLGQVIASKLLEAKKAGYLLDYSFLSTFDRDSVFNLFAQDYIEGYRYNMEELDILRSLPIYKTVLGSFTDLCSDDHCIISLNSFFKPCNEHCLSYSVESPEFSFLRALGVPQLLDQQILVRFQLSGYEGKSQAEQEDILIYLYMNWNELYVESSVVEALKQTNFVRNADEFSTDLSKPRDLFDPSDVLLGSIFSGERKKFPGERFSTEGWLRILRKLGLRTSAEADVILECTRRMEILGSECTGSTGELDDLEMDSTKLQNEVSMEIWALAESLMETIFSNFAVLYSNSFCSILGNIACVPAELGFPNVNGIKSGKRVLTSYSEAILSKDWVLAWSCTPILTKQNVVPPEYAWGALHLRSPPPFPTVLRHLKVIGRNCGEDTLASWPKSSNVISVDEASFEVFKYLNKIWGSLSSSDITELRTVAFMPAANGTRLVKANSLFVHLSVNLSPFAFELPTIYLPYINILKDLGLQETLSVASAKDLLFNLQKSCGYQRLNPNELRAVMQILSVLCDGTVKADTSDESMCKSEIIVPDDGSRLVHANLCVYVDSYASRCLKLIDTSKLRFAHPDLPEKICITLGIRKLSDVVVEELDQRQHLESLKNINSVHLAAVREKLLSKSFQGALWRILSTTVGHAPAVSIQDEGAVQSQLELLAGRLQFVKCLHTRFLLLSSSLDITRVNKVSCLPDLEDGSQLCRPYFLNRTKTNVLVAEPPTYISVLDIIAVVVSQFVGSPIPLPLGSLLSSPKGHELAVADFLRLYKNKVDTEETNFAKIGNEILPQDALQVQCHPLRPFYRGEIVAFRSKSGEKLKYGRVPEDVRPSAGQALYRFNVEIAPGENAPLLSSQIFSFRSTSIGKEMSSTTMTDAITLANNSGYVEVPESSDRAETRSSQPQKDLQYGQISAAELVQAVSEMLSAAGVSMDLEKQTLLKTTVTLQEQLMSSQAALTLEQEKVDGAVKEADAAKSAWLCRICLSCEVDVTIVPCGHVLCRRCSSAVPKCPFCRVPVVRTMKIFRP